MKERKCIKCGIKVINCTAVCIARDVLAYMYLGTNEIRELCGHCSHNFNYAKELGNSVAGIKLSVTELIQYVDHIERQNERS